MYGIININTIQQVQYNESRQLNNVALEQTRERKRAHMEDGATSLLGVFQFQIKHGFMTWFVRAWRGLFRNTYGFHMYTQYDVYVQWRVCSWMRRYAGLVCLVAWYSLHRRIYYYYRIHVYSIRYCVNYSFFLVPPQTTHTTLNNRSAGQAY